MESPTKPRPDVTGERLRAVRDAFDREAPRYDRDHSGPVVDVENAAIRRALASWSAGGRIVDIGCGTGLLLDLMPEVSVGRYLGVDLSTGMITEARRKHPGHRFIQGRGEDAQHFVSRTMGGYANLAVMLFSLYLMPNPAAVLTSIERFLVAGGTVYATLPTPRHRDAPCACHAYEPDGVAHYWTADEAWVTFSRHFHDVDVELLPSVGQPGHYLQVTGSRRHYRDPGGERPWHGPGG